MTERSYARRRRAAVPAALAAFVFLVIATGSDAPARWAGDPVAQELTIVLPAASAPTTHQPPDEPVSELPPADADPAPPPADEEAPPIADEPTDPPPDDEEEPSGEVEEDDGIRRVFLLVLPQTDLVALADDAAAAPYLAGELAGQGTLLTHHASAARGSLANAIALTSGQGPTQATLADCPTAAGAAPADVSQDVVGEDGQQLGDGCVYPFATGTVADQLTAAGLSWRAYLDDASAAQGSCPATPRNPFAFFHSLTDAGACARRVGGLDRLDADLARGASAPALLYLAPAPDAAGPDALLRALVPRILASEAYADGGLLVVTSDGPPPVDPAADPAAPPPSVPLALTPATYPNVGDAAAAGAGRVGALIVGERVRAGRRSDAPSSHFTLLRAIADLFALQPLGYAGAASLRPLPERILPPATATP